MQSKDFSNKDVDYLESLIIKMETSNDASEIMQLKDEIDKLTININGETGN